MENYGDYESASYGCEEVVCGCLGESATENATDDWDEVTCKKCLRLKDRVMAGTKVDEELICQQMGDMADFMSKEAQQVIQPDNGHVIKES